MHEKFMTEAILLAEEKIPHAEGGPFAAIIVKENRVIGRGWNRVIAGNDPTAHAEIVAIRDACARLHTHDLTGCALYVNCEPCPMCLAAAYWAGITAIYYAATREDAAAIGFADAHIYQEFSRPHPEKQIPLTQLMRDKALPALAHWNSLPDRILY
ncbi:nucleoside deaminase [Thiovibrio sp. JS02]